MKWCVLSKRSVERLVAMSLPDRWSWSWILIQRFQLVEGGSCRADPPRIMSIIAWNCRGLGNPSAVRVLADMVRVKKPRILFLMETFISTRKLEPIRVQLGFGNMLVIDAQGHRGSLALLWLDTVELEVLSYSNNHIDANVIMDTGSPQWRFTGFYGLPERHRRRESWGLLRNLSTLSSLPWLIMGDFNDFFHQSEKRGRLAHREWLIAGFRNTVADCGLCDFPFTGNQFTWERSRGTPAMVEEKLDRILVTETWLTMFEGAKVCSFVCPYSDHLPFMITPEGITNAPRRRRFCFDNMWLKETTCREIVEHSLDKTVGFDVLTRIAVCSKDIWK